MNLVVGSTGALGSSICRLLLEKMKPVRALVRPTSDRQKIDALIKLGADTFYADLLDPASLEAATRGVKTIITTATAIMSQQPNDSLAKVDDEGTRALIDAARANGVQHVVLVSVTRKISVSSPLVDAKRSADDYLRQAGIAYTILRPGPYFEFWLSALAGFDVRGRTARILGDGTQQISYVASSDVARIAVGCIDRPTMRNRIFELGGPAAISPLEAVRLYEKFTGSRFEVQFTPRTALEEQYQVAQHPVQKSFAGLMLALTYDNAIPMEAVCAEFGVQLTSASDFIQGMVGISASA